jgi:hypothetical protein
MQRVELQRWCNSHRELPTNGGFAPSPKEAASDSAVGGLATAPTHDEATMGISSPPTAAAQPDGSDNLDIPPFLDRRDPEKAFAALKAAWDNAPAVARSRFLAEVRGIGGDIPPQGELK